MQETQAQQIREIDVECDQCGHVDSFATLLVAEPGDRWDQPCSECGSWEGTVA